MKRHFAVGAMLCAAMVLSGVTAWAANGENTKKLDSQEEAFLRTAAQDDIFEERLGQYAADHAALEETKQFGKQMATDHRADLEQIEQLAKDHGVNLMTHDNDLTPQQKTIYDRLTSRPGKDFDKEYTKLALAEHNRMISLYQRQRDHAADADIREYAGKQVTGLEHHKQMATDAQKAAWGT
jgi:putative membrane protein